MSALLKLLSRALWNPKIKEVETDLDSLYSAIVESEVSAVTNDFQEIDNVPNNDEIVGDKCQYRTGTVTSVFSDHGLIDNNLYFNLREVSVNVREGMKVSYLGYKRRATDEWRVKKIMSVEVGEWDEVQTDDKNEVRDAKTRTVVGQVTKREGRNVIINSEITFSLDDVKIDFTPVQGDWVKLEALVEVDESVPDLSGEVLVVDDVYPLRWNVFTGNVTYWTQIIGSIDHKVFFTRDACESGYSPRVSDAVAVQAIESTQDQFAWRALSVVPLSIQKSCSVTKKSDQIEVLLKNKNGVVITEKLDFGSLNCGETRVIIAEVLNTGRKDFYFKSAKFHSSRKSSQMTVLNPNENVGVILHPQDKMTFQFSCKGRTLGKSSELFVFTFNNFRIGRYLEVEVQDPQLNSLLLQWQSNELHVNGCSFNAVRKIRQRTPKGIIVSGVRPIKPPAFIPVRLGTYLVPERLWEAVLNSENIDIAIDNVLAKVPSLKSDLNFSNFVDHFHNILFLEEIEQCLRIQQYSIERAKFSFVGCEFLSLEVPGLAEKRPSLLIGDKIIAIPLDGSCSMQYEGYIHKVHCTEIWLKFNDSFHSTYVDEEYSISFHESRTPLKRCHFAVDLAVKNLGRNVLFPRTVSMKEPQLLLIEKETPRDPKEQMASKLAVSVESSLKISVELKWFNRCLNQKQKEAVSNILRGEARPLPYVIFGPPGTGKTITLVETILQIMCNIPESRLLVATPSNSSADLIAERLLDSGALRPGDLVRLVGYHCIEEGTIPPRLIPYVTTGEIRLNRQEYVNFGKLKTSSNSSTLGRHRITVGTCISLGQLYIMGFPRGHFTHVLVDEAGQATEPEILIPLGLLHTDWGQIILAGDPLQLGPVVSSPIANHFGLGQSYLSRLLRSFPYQRDSQGFSQNTGGYNPCLVTRLVMNYRSLPEILRLASSLFYDNELQPQVCSDDSKEAKTLTKLATILPSRKCEKPPAILFHGIRGINYRDKDCPSWFNPQEMVQALYYIRKLFDQDLSPDDLGIITPYQRQVQKIRELLEQLEFPVPKIGSVEEFQGQERLVIILSTVRSSSDLVPYDLRHALGFVSSPQRLNVSVTRARALLIILGNPHLLYLDPHWRNVIDYCVKKDAYIGCDLPLDIESTA